MKKVFTTAAACACALALVSNANAIPLSIGDAYYLGEIENSAPASAAAEVGYINNLITLAAGAGNTLIDGKNYDRLLSTVAGPFPTAVTGGAVKDEEENNPSFDNEIDATGFAYILGKYGTRSYVWFINGALGIVEVPADLDAGGLSHISLYNPGNTPPPPRVPDGGSMLGLLGLSLAGLGVFRRKIAA